MTVAVPIAFLLSVKESCINFVNVIFGIKLHLQLDHINMFKLSLRVRSYIEPFDTVLGK